MCMIRIFTFSFLRWKLQASTICETLANRSDYRSLNLYKPAWLSGNNNLSFQSKILDFVLRTFPPSSFPCLARNEPLSIDSDKRHFCYNYRNRRNEMI